MNTVHKEYQKVFALSKNARILEGINSILDWDRETYMPPGGSEIRSEQLETMAKIIHGERTSRKFSLALSKLIDIPTGTIIAKNLNPSQMAAAKEWRRDYLHNTALPAKFVAEFAKVTSQAVIAWRMAKKDNAFLQFAPYLDRIVQLCRKKADLLGFQDHPYDALLDEYEPEVKTKEIDILFAGIRSTLSPLIKKIGEQPIDDQFLFGNWDKAKQLAFGHKLLDAMGYDKEKGRVDLSTHPFSSASHPSDSRITTRIHPKSLLDNISIILHEGGHALYEMGLPKEEYGTPLGEARSLGIHESQSRWWETRIGQSRPFWEHFFPLLKETFKEQLQSVSLDMFYRAINAVRPDLIRVEADEMTYPMHVILRFELEKKFIEGSLQVRDLPEVWNVKMKEYLGVVPSTNAEGCLQDIHWGMGSFGYFPTYTLGNLYAAHLFDGFAQKHPDWEKKVASGSLEFIREWLRENIYRHGKRYSTGELLKKATGHPFSSQPYLDYLKKKYGSIYCLTDVSNHKT